MHSNMCTTFRPSSCSLFDQCAVVATGNAHGNSICSNAAHDIIAVSRRRRRTLALHHFTHHIGVVIIIIAAWELDDVYLGNINQP